MNNTTQHDAFSRQSFLGPSSQAYIERCVIGVAGLGGGGSHITQQLAHLGFLKYVLFDQDVIEDSNLNRLIGGTQLDVEEKRPKVDIAKRTILGVRPNADVLAVQDVWQNRPEALKGCDIVFGCVDGFDQRRQLEATTRRYLIPLIDIGMDVHMPDEGAPAMAGQVILSMPGCTCMACMGFLNAQNLKREAEAYGDAGPRPQVVWPNGILASVAVGLAVDLITNWSATLSGPIYHSFRGGAATIAPDPTLRFAPDVCLHFPLEDSGDPRFRRL
ncbi:MAG TPA: ThiF family adenylyltransferase [Rhizobium sp.]|nr:ThiF family adenylyltransferase [Rhizobium sp.]